MNEPTNNRTLAFLTDFGAALDFLWHKFLNRLAQTSWWKALFISALALIVAGIFAIAKLVGLLVLVALSIKLFTPSQKAAITNEPTDLAG